MPKPTPKMGYVPSAEGALITLEIIRSALMQPITFLSVQVATELTKGFLKNLESISDEIRLKQSGGAE